VEGVAAGQRPIVDVEWSPTPSATSSAYRAYRINGGSTQLVCSLTQATQCQDTSPPSAATLYYYVVAVDRDSTGSPRRGQLVVRPQIAVTQTKPPAEPADQSPGEHEQRHDVLHWTAPLVQDPDLLLGDHIAFLPHLPRRLGVLQPYDRTGAGTDVTYTDTQTSGVPHTTTSPRWTPTSPSRRYWAR